MSVVNINKREFQACEELLEAFLEDEMTDCVIIGVGKDGDILAGYSATSRMKMLGMIEAVKISMWKGN